MNIFKMMASFCFLLGVSGNAWAQEWEKLGARQVDFGLDKDQIVVTGNEGTFNAIKLTVTGGDLLMYNIRVTFGDGSSFSPPTRMEFTLGSQTRTIDLPGQARVIRKVEFLYRSKIKRGKATVTLHGRRGTGGAPVRWEELGSRKVAFRGDKDTIMVTGKEGRFTSLRLVVTKSELVMFNVKVTFGDGTSYSPGTRLNFDQKTTTRELDLPGGARVINRVEFWYTSKIKKGRATVTLFGKHGAAPVAVKWEKLGSREVSVSGDKDTIKVSAVEGRFTAIKIVVTRSDIRMHNVKVTFGDGSTFSPETRFQFDKKSDTRVIDLPGGGRVIKKVEFLYRSRPKTGPALVTLFGKSS